MPKMVANILWLPVLTSLWYSDINVLKELSICDIMKNNRSVQPSF